MMNASNLLSLVVAGVLASRAGFAQQPTPGEKVSLQARGGPTLAAEYVTAEAPTGAVVFFPMCSPGSSEGWSPVIAQLREHGVSSLIVTYGWERDNWKAFADAAVAYLRSRVGATVALAVAGSSCGVDMALSTASLRDDAIRAAVALTGPHNEKQVAFIRRSPSFAIFSGAGENDGPAPTWARELREASSNADSKLVLVPQKAHGTDLFKLNDALATQIADWLRARLRTK